jgi:hypothetical protein
MAVTEKVSADMADKRAAKRPHEIAEREHAESGKQLSDWILMREELSPNRGGEIAVDRKIVPFEHVADHSGRNHPAYVRGVHLAPKAYLMLLNTGLRPARDPLEATQAQADTR